MNHVLPPHLQSRVAIALQKFIHKVGHPVLFFGEIVGASTAILLVFHLIPTTNELAFTKEWLEIFTVVLAVLLSKKAQNPA